MEATGLAHARKELLHRRALRLEYFTVSWNVIEAVVAITAGLIAGSVALIGFGVDSGIEVISAVALRTIHALGPKGRRSLPHPGASRGAPHSSEQGGFRGSN